MSTRLRAILEMRQAALAQKLEIDLEKSQTIPGDKYVFGNELGEPVKGFKRAWERAVLKAHGHRPTYRVRIVGEGKAARKVPTAALTAESRAALRRIGLHFHDLRREAGSRWLERGLSLHQVRDLLGHSNIAQTSTYLAADAGDIHEAMRRAEARVSALPPIATDSEKGVINASQGSTVANSATQESSARHH